MKDSENGFGAMALGVVFVAFALLGVYDVMQPEVMAKPKGWMSNPCTVVTSCVERVASGTTWKFQLHVQYRYSINGTSYEGISESSFRRLANRLPMLKLYAPGSVNVCSVNPEDPFKSVMHLNNPEREMLSGLIGSLIFLCLGVCAIIAPFWGKAGWLMLLFMGIPFVGASGIGLVRIAWTTCASQQYVETPAEILYAGVESSGRWIGRGISTTNFRPIVGYRYVVAGEVYENDEYNYFEEMIGSEDTAKSEISHYHVGDITTIYRSLRSPSASVLKCPYGIFDVYHIIVYSLAMLGGVIITYVGIKHIKGMRE